MAGAFDELFLAEKSSRMLIGAISTRDPDPWGRARSMLEQVPPREKERQRRVAKIHHHAVDSWHPPTSLRIDRVMASPHRAAQVTLDLVTDGQIARELMTARAQLIEMIVMGQSTKRKWRWNS
jgi:hypothetical protein